MKKFIKITFFLLSMFVFIQNAYSQDDLIDDDDFYDIIERYNIGDNIDKNDFDKLIKKKDMDDLFNRYSFGKSYDRNYFIEWFINEIRRRRFLDVRVDGGWTDLTIGSADLVGGAGTDLIDTYTSDSNASRLDVRRARNYDFWRVDVSREDINWHENLYLYARRTGNGHGHGQVYGGSSYIELNNIDRELFHGRGRLNNIPIQYQLSGVSLQVPPDTYGTTIIFTVVKL